jgi:hypothetical protein
VTTLVLAVALALVAVGAALVLQRRRPDAPTDAARWTVPAQVDRADFSRPDAPWLVAVFTSATCHTCAATSDKARQLDSHDVAVEEVEVSAAPALHRRYRIDAVPIVVVADADGVVRASFVGPCTATDLWATVAELREPGSVPPGCDHGQPAAADRADGADGADPAAG